MKIWKIWNSKIIMKLIRLFINASVINLNFLKQEDWQIEKRSKAFIYTVDLRNLIFASFKLKNTRKIMMM